MKTDIQSKLRDVLELENVSEKDAVYFLVELYKLMELNNVKKEFPAIFFYRNWAVHVRLSHDSDFKDWLANIFKEIHVPDRQIPDEVFRFTYFDVLAREVISLWRQYIDDREMKTSDYFFKKFRSALIQVIADVPVTLQYKNEEFQLSFAKEGWLNIIGPGIHSGRIHAL